MINRHFHSALFLTGMAIFAGLSIQTKSAGAQTASDVVCSGCVSARDIRDNTIRSKDIRDGQVKSPDLARNSVNSAKIRNRSIKGADIANGAIRAAHLGLANTIYIEDSGSETDNCTELLGVLDGLSGPAAVVLGPGAFDCQSNPIILTTQISLIGSGENLTSLIGSVEGLDGFISIRGSGVTVRGLNVTNDDREGSGGSFIAIVVGGGLVDSPNSRIRDVVAVAANGSTRAVALYFRLVNCDGGQVDNVLASGSGALTTNRGMDMQCAGGSSLSVNNLTASGIGSNGFGVGKFDPSRLIVRNSSLVGSNASIRQLEGTVTAISSELDGGIVGDATCVGNYDENGVALTDGESGSGGCI
ncbi:MAG: hypothetical protein AAF530_19645 [Pseudomonadota bacterium]